MRKIALDVGDKTVGIALSDELGITAQGLMTLERVGIRKDTGKILDLVKEYQCDTIVIGLPKKLDGTDSIQTEKVYEFRTMLENKMRSTGMKNRSSLAGRAAYYRYGGKGSHRSRCQQKEEKTGY